MTIEEKAKAYDEAIEALRSLFAEQAIKHCDRVNIKDITNIFSELKESEDERIREDILTYLSNVHDNVLLKNKETWITWLEKQGEQNLANFAKTCKDEQKPADKVELKFKVGDSISKKHNSDINKFGIFTITSISDNKYWYNNSVVCDFSDQDLWELVERPKFKKGDWVFHNTAEFIYMIQTIGRDGYGVISRDGKKSVVYYSAEINYRLWTIQDAKCGDVLATPDYILIFKEFLKNDGGISYCHYDFGAGNPQFIWLEDNNWYFGKEAIIHPATKEQRDLLFQKMHEAGYEWDPEKKELKKIEQKYEEKPIISLKDFQEAFELKARQYEINLPNRGYDIHAMCKELYSMLIKQKPAWSEEDENRFNNLIFLVECSKEGEATKQGFIKFINRLKSLRPQTTWKPSEEEMEALEHAISCYSGISPTNANEVFILEIMKERLKNLTK